MQHYLLIVFVVTCIITIPTSCGTVLTYLKLFNEFCKIWREKSLNFILPEVSPRENDLFYHDIFDPFQLEYCKQKLIYYGSLRNMSNIVSKVSAAYFWFAKSPQDVSQEIQRSRELFNGQIWLLPESFLHAKALLLLKLTSEVFCYENKNNETTIIEKYSILSSVSKSVVFGHYANTSGLHVSSANKWERRKNFTGVTMTLAAMEWKPFTEKVSDGDGKFVQFTGIFPMLVQDMKKVMDFEIEWVLPSDGKWGIKGDDGHWNGLVGLLEEKKIDLVCAAITLVIERTLVMDFTFPVYHETFTLISQKKNEENAINLWGYIAIFRMEAWLLIFLLLCCMAISYFFRKKVLCKDIFIGAKANAENFVSSVSLVYFTFIQLEYPIHLRSVSTKVLYTTTCIFACIIFLFYSADLTARLTVIPTSSQIKSFAEAYEQDYSVGVLGESVTEAMMAFSIEGSGINDVWKYIVEPNPELTVSNKKELMEHIMKSEKNLAFAEITSFTSDPRQVGQTPTFHF